MQPLVFFLLGKKGKEVLKATIASDNKDLIRLVVIGADRNVQEDFFNETESLCIEHGLDFCLRDDKLKIDNAAVNSTAIVAGWRWLIEYEFIQIIVFHDSMLPKYRGFNPLVTALLNQDSEIGVTAIVANKKFDCGDIVESKSIQLKYPITIEDAINKLCILYFDIQQSILKKLISTRFLAGAPQDETLASYSVWRDEEDYRIDWGKSAESIAHFIKCVSFPYKGASTICDGKLFRIIEAEVEPDVLIENRSVGKVIFVLEGKPVVICGDGLLRIIVAVDDDGKSILPFKNFRVRLK
jgi:methionyl-tRNA formyltransferase